MSADRRTIRCAEGCPHEHLGKVDRFTGGILDPTYPETWATGFPCVRCGGAVIDLLEPGRWDEVAAAARYHYFREGWWSARDDDGEPAEDL